MKVKLEDVERFERHVKMRLAFRFGVITVTDATQAVIRVRISLPDGRTSHGVAAEALAAKWFEKSPAFTDAQNLDQLRQALDLAIELYRAQGFDKPFDLFAGTYVEQHKRGAALGLNPLVASYGPALLDRAILDALGQATGQSFATMIARNVPGIRTTSLTPDIADADLGPFLCRPRARRPSIEVRHTVGLVDPLTAADRPAAERVNDGLPETLEEVVVLLSRPLLQAEGRRRHQGRSRAAVGRIAAVLDAGAGDYRTTLDGNEQYDDVEGIVELWRKVEETPALARLAKSTLFIEQPIKRAVALVRVRWRRLAEAPRRDHRRVGWRAVVFPDGADARLCRRLEQELQGLLQVDPERRARRQARRRPLHVGRGSHDLARASACSRIWRWCRCSASAMSSATLIISSTACRLRAGARAACVRGGPSRSL